MIVAPLEKTTQIYVIAEWHIFIRLQKRKHDGDENVNGIHKHKKSKVNLCWNVQLEILDTSAVLL